MTHPRVTAPIGLGLAEPIVRPVQIVLPTKAALWTPEEIEPLADRHAVLAEKCAEYVGLTTRFARTEFGSDIASNSGYGPWAVVLGGAEGHQSSPVTVATIRRVEGEAESGRAGHRFIFLAHTVVARNLPLVRRHRMTPQNNPDERSETFLIHEGRETESSYVDFAEAVALAGVWKGRKGKRHSEQLKSVKSRIGSMEWALSFIDEAVASNDANQHIAAARQDTTVLR